jgi:hypothetical protein
MRSNCINTASGIVTLSKWPSDAPVGCWLVGWMIQLKIWWYMDLQTLKHFRRVRKTAKSDYRLLHVCITPALYIRTIYRIPVGRAVITFYTLCLGGNLSTGLPLQISSDWNVIFEVRNSHASMWTTQCCISQHAEHFNVSLDFDYLKDPAYNSRLKRNH